MQGWRLSYFLIICSMAFGEGAAFPQAKAVPCPLIESHPGPAWFEDVASKAGPGMLNVNGVVDTNAYYVARDIEVRWPSSQRETFAALAADRFITLEEGTGSADSSH
jgi:hypothetical protein